MRFFGETKKSVKWRSVRLNSLLLVLIVFTTFSVAPVFAGQQEAGSKTVNDNTRTAGTAEAKGTIILNATANYIPGRWEGLPRLDVRLLGPANSNIRLLSSSTSEPFTGPYPDDRYKLPAGNYTLSDYEHPDFSVSLSPGKTYALDDNETIRIYLTYYRHRGTLKVITKTSDGRDLPAGAGWTIGSRPEDYTGEISYNHTYNKGTNQNVHNDQYAETGDYSINVNDLDGWSESVSLVGASSASPAANSGSLAQGEDLEFEITYTSHYGRLIINIINGDEGIYNLPSAAGWQFAAKPQAYAVSNGEDNLDDENVPPGPYVVRGKRIDGWNYNAVVIIDGVPSSNGSSASGTLEGGKTLIFDITYKRKTGSMVFNVVNGSDTQGYTLPNTAGWRFAVKPGDFPDGKPVEGGNGVGQTGSDQAPTGNYTVAGKDVEHWSYDVTVINNDAPKAAPSLAEATTELLWGNTLIFTITYTRQFGTLIFTYESNDGSLLPDGVGINLEKQPSGAPFGGQAYDGGKSYFSYTFQNPAPVGTYGFSVRQVTGWSGEISVVSTPGQTTQSGVSPSATSVEGELTEGGTIEFIATYTKLGTLIIDLVNGSSGNYDDPDGWGWEIVTNPGEYSGAYTGNADYTNANAYPGAYQVEADDVDGWSEVITVTGGTSPDVAPSGIAPNAGVLEEGDTLKFTITYTRNTGYLQVKTLTSDGSDLPAGAGWNLTHVDPGDYTGLSSISFSGGEASGQTHEETSAATGDYSLTGKPVFGWAVDVNVVANEPKLGAPSAVTENGELVDFGSVVFTVTYTEQLGELEVIILPESIRPLAGWREPGQVAFKKSWPEPEGTENLVAGFYNVEFKDVDGWFTPSTQVDVQVNPGAKTTITAIYTENPAGSLQVFMEDNLDDRVKNMGAQWQPVFPSGSEIGVALADTWYNSGDIIAGIEPGSIGLRFKTVSGFILPELGGASVEADKKTVATGQYYRQIIIHKSDYNGDGTDDLAVFDGDSATWSVASISKPAATPGAVDLFETKFGKSDDIPTAGDYDGDGVADLAYWREATGEWRVNKQFKLKNFGQINDIPVPGDYNGDGMTDPALYRPSTGEWIIYNVETKKTTKVAFGDLADVPVPGNYNAEQAGMTDLAVYNVETNKWRVAIYDANKQKWVEKRKVKVNGKKIKLKTAHGAVGNVPVQADYDGDGATDLAVYVRGSSEWNIRGSEMIQLGAKGDVPVPNDWAGLGRVIPTIFHPKNGRWLAIDNLLRTKHGKGGQPLMSGR